MADPRGTRKWKELREKVFIQQGRQCAQCGGTENLEIDHIKPYDTHPELGMDITNLQVLCKTHNIAKSNKAAVQRQRTNWYNKEWLSNIA